MDPTTQARLERAADEAEIRNVVARLAQLADTDTDDLTAYLALWTADGVSVHPGSTDTGHAEIRARTLDRRRDGIQGPGTDTMHVSTTQWVDVRGDTATSRSYWFYYAGVGDAGVADGEPGGAGPALRLMGTYDDELVRTAQGWKLARRRVVRGT